MRREGNERRVPTRTTRAPERAEKNARRNAPTRGHDSGKVFSGLRNSQVSGSRPATPNYLLGQIAPLCHMPSSQHVCKSSNRFSLGGWPQSGHFATIRPWIDWQSLPLVRCGQSQPAKRGRRRALLSHSLPAWDDAPSSWFSGSYFGNWGYGIHFVNKMY